MLQFPVLILQLLQLLGITAVQAAVLRLAAVEVLLAYALPAEQFCGVFFGLLQSRYDLLFTAPATTHFLFAPFALWNQYFTWAMLREAGHLYHFASRFRAGASSSKAKSINSARMSRPTLLVVDSSQDFVERDTLRCRRNSLECRPLWIQRNEGPPLRSARLVRGDCSQMKLKAPVFVVGCPRSGTALLYGMLLSSDRFVRYSAETDVFYGIAPALEI